MRTKITVTIENDEGLRTVVFQADGVNLEEERGALIIHNLDDPCPVRIESTEQRRMRLTAWAGCSDFDSFVTKEYATSLDEHGPSI